MEGSKHFRRDSMSQAAPKLMIATRIFGASGQPWMWRQVIGLRGFRKELICWERQNAATQATTDVREHVLAGAAAPYDTSARWLYRLRAFPHGSFYASFGEEQARLKTLFDTHQPDVILCNFGDVAMRLLPTAFKAGIPLVAYFHGDFSFIRNRWYRWSLYRCLTNFAAIVVVTDAERQWLLRQNVPEEKIHFIPCGAPTRLFLPQPRRPDGLVRFVMVSRLAEDKGCDLSIEAFSRVAATNPDVRLDIYGDGPTRGNLEEQVKGLRLADKVNFHGYVDEISLARNLPHHDIFIQHSRIKEGAPVSVIEAMACALPVVATSIGGIPDQVQPGRTGYLFAEGDVAGMAAAMGRLASDPDLRKQMGCEARAQAVAHHDAETQTGRLGDLLMRIARPKVEQRERRAVPS